MEHKLIPPENRHAPHSWVVADAAARAALVVTEADLGKYCWQKNENSEWMLIGHTPAAWRNTAASINSEDLLKRANHTGMQAIETVEGLEEALAKRIAKSSDTGVMYVPEGTDAQRPLAADIPAGVAAVRGNSTSLTDRFLEFWNRATNTWDAIASRKWVTDLIAKLFSPTLSGSAVLTGADNKLVLAGVVAELGLEKGDVVRVVAGAYNKLHTVESLPNNNEIVVNYEHCGSRGNGPLKLSDYTGPVTVTRIAKWHSCDSKLGRDYVDVTALRARNTNHPNSTGRPFSVYYSTVGVSNATMAIYINDVIAVNYTIGHGQSGGVAISGAGCFDVGIGATYNITFPLALTIVKEFR